MDKVLMVFLGGGLGAVSRYGLGIAINRSPYGTLAANILGGFLMGVLVTTLALKGGSDQERFRVLLGVGVLGGFTTFSAYSLEVALMIERKAYGAAALYASASVAMSIAALFAGMLLMRRLLA